MEKHSLRLLNEKWINQFLKLDVSHVPRSTFRYGLETWNNNYNTNSIVGKFIQNPVLDQRKWVGGHQAKETKKVNNKNEGWIRHRRCTLIWKPESSSLRKINQQICVHYLFWLHSIYFSNGCVFGYVAVDVLDTLITN